MTIQDIEKIARLSMNFDCRPVYLRDIEDQQKKILCREEPIFYYNFLFLIARLLNPKVILELGTLHGGSGWHLAVGAMNGTVHTVDSSESNEGILLDSPVNLILHRADSLDEWLPPQAPLGILFADTIHTYDHTMKEYLKYRLLMDKGSVMIFDDIHISSEMERFWVDIPDSKADLSFLHQESGFGACVIE